MASRTEKLGLMNQFADIALNSIRGFVPIRRFGRLRLGIRKIVTTDRVTIFSIYYWTRFVNDGRRGITAGPQRPLIYFKDPKKDPRIKQNYPRQPKQIQRLTREQFRYHRKRKNLIITDQVGPAEGLHFIEQGLQECRPKVRELGIQRIRQDVRSNIRRRNNSISVRL